LAVVEWCKQQKDTITDGDVKSLFQQIRYPLIQEDDLIEKVHPTNMADPDLYKAALKYHDTDNFDGPEDQLTLRKFYFNFSVVLPEYENDLKIEHTGKGTMITNTNGNTYKGTNCFTVLFLRDDKPVNFILTFLFLCDDSETQLLLHSRNHYVRYEAETVVGIIPLGEEVQGSVTKSGKKISAEVGDVRFHIFLRDDDESCHFGIKLHKRE